MTAWSLALLIIYAVVQVGYFISLVVSHWYYTMPIDEVDPQAAPPSDLPKIMLLYPVLRELESTMRTTMTAIAALDYPSSHYRVVGIPNDSDAETIESLRRLQHEFPFLELMTVPATTSPEWDVVWRDWSANPKAYWFHHGKRAGERALPPKKTRQLIFALYNLFTPENAGGWLVSYMDADSAPPRDLFRLAAIGSQDYDVLQTTNVAGNLMKTPSSSFHALDHLSWDASMWPHQSANGQQPYWVLGKGLFYRATDLLDFGGFHPWLTIEDPEVGMRLWTNGKRLGVMRSPLIEEVPDTFRMGITQRKRWVAGFFQSLHSPLTHMGMTPSQRFRARLNFVPCLSLLGNVLGLPVGIVVIILLSAGVDLFMPAWLVVLSIANIVMALIAITRLYVVAWRESSRVLPTRGRRTLYLLRVNPVFLMAYWLLWTVPLAIGFSMFVRDGGLVWERTEKKDQNHGLVRDSVTELPRHRIIVRSDDDSSTSPTTAL